jgi:hypothetical protein
MRIEIQIRDRAMHAQAERGLAAHWAYKEGKPIADLHVPWIDDLVEILDHADSPEELLEHTRMAMYQDRIFAFTPKGELIQLPKGATPVDFAFAVHTAWATRRSARRSMAASCHFGPSSKMATRSKSSLRKRSIRSRAGCASSRPARRGRRSGASCATKSAKNRSNSAARSTDEDRRPLPAELGKDGSCVRSRSSRSRQRRILMMAIARLSAVSDEGADGGVMPGRPAATFRRAPLSQRPAISIKALTPGVRLPSRDLLPPESHGGPHLGLRREDERSRVTSSAATTLASGSTPSGSTSPGAKDRTAGARGWW